RDIENLCGIKAHTLRIWEQRYQIFVAKRKESQHRIYDNEDLKDLLRISTLYHSGYKISKLACLTREEMNQAIASSVTEQNNLFIHVNQLIAASIDFNKEKFDKIVHNLILHLGIEKTITGVFYPFLERIGTLWLTNNVIPAQEHFSSHLIRKKIICATDGLDMVTDECPSVALFSFPGEFHEIPLLLVNYLFRKNNIATYYFGVNVKTGTLKEFAAERQVDYFYTHIITHFCCDELNQGIEKLYRLFPDKKIIVSGPAVKYLTLQVPNLEILHSLDEVMDFTERIKKTKSLT
ncbi:MAG: MerR family transcriptional regulator, partial [Bacteroidetes bacterium]|nr:MerR family transcriptional regulator [Bacteroidota bacterium]